MMSGKFILVPYSLQVETCRVGNKLLAKRNLSMLLSQLFFPYLQDRKKGFLRNFDVTNLFHSFFSRFLFFQKLAFAGNVPSVAFCENVLAQGFNAFPGDNVRPN